MLIHYCDQCKTNLANKPHFEIKEMIHYAIHKGVGSVENIDFCNTDCFSTWMKANEEAPPIVQQLKPPGPLVGLDGKRLAPNG